jgi:hypothetical protein
MYSQDFTADSKTGECRHCLYIYILDALFYVQNEPEYGASSAGPRSGAVPHAKPDHSSHTRACSQQS